MCVSSSCARLQGRDTLKHHINKEKQDTWSKVTINDKMYYNTDHNPIPHIHYKHDQTYVIHFY